MLIVGLTGGIASGKSKVAEYLAELGAVCVDTDTIAHEIMVKGTAVYDSLVEHFGEGILAVDGSIRHDFLADEVFNDADQLAALNKIVHPSVIEEVRRLIKTWREKREDGIRVVQVPLLIEAGMADMFDVIIVVAAGAERQTRRLKEGGFTFEEATARIRSQVTDSERLPFADYTIINKGDINLLKKQTASLYKDLSERAKKIDSSGTHSLIRKRKRN